VSNPIDKIAADKDHAFDANRFGVSPQKCPTWAQTEGTTLPLGATWTEEGRAFNFAVHAEHAASVTLLLYSADIARAARGLH
jgi:pullulanase/glycogen debranching enzyme